MQILIPVLLAYFFIALAALLIAPPIIVWYGSRQAWRCGRLYITRLTQALGIPDPATAVRPPTPPRHHPEDGREPAYEHYLYGQASRDLKLTLSQTLDQGRKEVSQDWARIRKERLEGYWTLQALWRHLIGVILLAGLGLGTLLAVLFIGVVVAVQAALVAVLAALTILAARGLRAADGAILAIRRIRMHCPSCSRPVSYPAYRCPACGAWHHDIRPGRYGVLRRRCSCGDRDMPTLLILGSHRMRAYCPHPGCEVELTDQSGTAAELTLPILGGPGAGKTRLMAALIMALSQNAARDDGAGASADQTTARRLKDLLPALAANEPTLPTPPGPSRAFAIRVVPGARVPRVLHLFDSGGGNLSFADSHARRNLRVADTFLFVIDPLSIQHLRGQFDAELRPEAPVPRASPSPKDIFDVFVQLAQELGTNLRASRLGVALSRADLLPADGQPGSAADSACIERWLDELGQDHLTRAMRRLFGEVRYFRTAAMLAGEQVDESVMNLAQWLLAGWGLSGTGRRRP
jgi:Zn finger protein HypA/HybF involved in hydrogenase expression